MQKPLSSSSNRQNDFNNLNNFNNLNTKQSLLEPLTRDSTISNEENSNKKEFNYERPIEYWLIIIGYAIGYGSFWRFPYLVYSCGGGVFFIPFLIFFFLLAIPLFTLETLLGQVFKRGPVEVCGMIRKKFLGVGWASVVTSFIVSIYYAIILCWSVYFFFQSFIYPLPWSKEAAILNNVAMGNSTLFHENNNVTDLSTFTNYTNNDESNIEENFMNLDYFSKEVLKISEGITNMGSVNGGMALCLVITYILIFVCIYEGIHTSSKVVYVTAPAPIILLLVLFFK
jgi:SNF family Na+-dependent transporter